jgi:DNA-binding CsgD family transcriptional regulator
VTQQRANKQAAKVVAPGFLPDQFILRAIATDPSLKVLIDGNCNVVWCSDGAEQTLQPPLPLCISDGRLLAAADANVQNWIAYLEGLDGEGGALLLTGNQEGAWVLVRGWSERCEDQRLIFLKCATPLPLRTVASSGLGHAFGLTPSECAVLDLFSRLMKPHQIAEKLQISLSTVRSHLKQIHAKMSVKSSTQLLRLTLAYCDT